MSNNNLTMTITIFVKPDTIGSFLETAKILSYSNLENNYKFDPNSFEFSEIMIPNYIIINMPISDYLKLKYYYNTINK